MNQIGGRLLLPRKKNMRNHKRQRVCKAIAITLLLLAGCSMSEVIDRPEPRQADTSVYVPRQRKEKVDSTYVDTTRIPISFDVYVEDW